MLNIRRRQFIRLLGGTAAAWPLMALAQTLTKRPLIAWLSGGARTSSWVFVEAFLQGMREYGYVEEREFDIVYRFADGYFERLPSLAEELIRLNPDVILAPASGPAIAAKKATATIPIVTPALADAVHLGLIASESRPGGNITGITPYVAGLPAKQMELAREVVPSAARIGVLANLSDPKAPPQWQELEAAGRELGVNVIAEDVSTPDDLDGAFQALARQRVDVLIVLQTSIGASAWKSVPIYRYVPRLFFSGRRSVGVHPRLNDLAEGINSILQKVPGGRSGHAQAIHRAVQSTELDRCLPELFPSHNFCNKDGRCPQRPLTPSVRLVRWL